MAGDQPIVKGAQPVEYIEETSGFASPQGAAKTWNWIGVVQNWSVTQSVETETIRYLPAEGASDKLEKRMNVANAEMWEADLTYNPQDYTLLQYFTGASGGTSDSLATLQFGEIEEDNGEYRRLLGAVGEEWTLSVSENETAEVSASFMMADGENWSTTDYIDSTNGGAHASEDASEPFGYDDLSNVTLGGVELDHAIESLELSISNDLEVVRDPNAGRGSHIAALVPTSREITVDLTLSYSDMSMASRVRNYTSETFEFTLGGTTFTVNDVQFPEFPYEFGPEDLVGDSVTSDPAGTISWA